MNSEFGMRKKRQSAEGMAHSVEHRRCEIGKLGGCEAGAGMRPEILLKAESQWLGQANNSSRHNRLALSFTFALSLFFRLQSSVHG